MISRIVLMTGGVETLTYFSMELGQAFEEKGYNVFYYDLKEGDTCFSKLKRFLKPKETVLVTFNHIGASKETLLYHPQYGYIWERFEVPVYSIVVDHPLYYHSHLIHSVKKYHYIGIDRNHTAYVKKYYPKVKFCEFLPLAGMELHMEKEEKRLQKERDIPVLFTGNYQIPEKFNPYIERLDEEYTQFYHKVIRELLMQPEKTLEEVVKLLCIQEMGEISDIEFAEVMAHMNFIDLYVRNSRRGNVIRTIVHAGIPVEVVGDGWEKLPCSNPQLLKIHAQSNTRDCLALMQRAQISLNVMPDFKDGAHDRIFSSILNGAVCVSDSSIYLKENLPEGTGICYYDMRQLEALPLLLKGLLKDSQKREEIVKKGYETVKEKHTWKKRAEDIINWIESA